MAQKLSIADLRISSSAFEEHGRIPARHTVEGEDVSPALRWSGAPQGTKAFAIVCHDPDAPLVDGFTHWLAYGISGDTSELPEAADGLETGTNSFGNAGYGEDVRIDEEDVGHREKRGDGAAELAGDRGATIAQLEVTV